MANATFIDYDPFGSKKALAHPKNKGSVKMMNGGIYTGYQVEDTFCLDDEEDVCIQKFSFYEITDSENIKEDPQRLFHQGVIPFNRYGYPDRENDRIISMLNYEDILYNYTVHFDFNLPASMFKTKADAPKSNLYVNGFEWRVVKWNDEPSNGVVWHPNVYSNSTWEMNLTDFKWREKTFIEYTFPHVQKTVVIATASNLIHLPVKEFENIFAQVKETYPDFEIVDD